MQHVSRRLPLVLLAVLLLAITIPALAQTGLDDGTVDPNANISFPPPVYVVRGVFPIRGSANLPEMTNYFIEYRPLAGFDTVEVLLDAGDAPSAPTATLEPDEGWLPAVASSTTTVQDDVLGEWDTTLLDDGVYELRLTVNVGGGEPVVSYVRPIRVENTPSPFAPVDATAVPAEPTPIPPTLEPTIDPNPRATARNQANVRTGDSTLYTVITTLQAGQGVPIVGISTVNGWYVVQLDNGRQGFVAPSVVDVTGNVSVLPRIAPPPPPVTPTPIPTPTPVTQVNFVAGNVRIDPASPNCAQTFNVFFDVANFGTAPNTITGFIDVRDARAADNVVQGNTLGPLPIIQPGQTLNIGPIPLTISTFYNETHTLTLTIDPSNQIPETNEGDNVRQIQYTLNKGACP